MDAAQHIRVSLLDGFTIRLDCAGPAGDGGELPRGVQRLVASLCLAGRPARTAVAGQLWPDLSEGHAQGSLRSALWRLQKTAPGLIEASGGALCLARGVRVDVREFREWARQVLDPGSDVTGLPAPLDSATGELLPGWYDDWVLFEREQLRQLRMHALEVLAHRFAVAGRHADAVQAAYAAVRVEPLRESAHRVVVRVHMAEGNVTEAVRAYEHFRSLLADELGVRPTALMEDLVRRIPRRARVTGPSAAAGVRSR
jgi:DNA-binding SARP family transcriptional activator